MIDDTDAIEAPINPLPVELYDQEAIAIFWMNLPNVKRVLNLKSGQGKISVVLERGETSWVLGEESTSWNDCLLYENSRETDGPSLDWFPTTPRHENM
jgi:hypothetical protein